MSLITLYKDGDKENPLIIDSPWIVYGMEGLGYPDINFGSEPYAFEDGSYWADNQAQKRVISFSCINRNRDSDYMVRNYLTKFFNHKSEYAMVIELDGRYAYVEGRITDFQIPIQKADALIRFSLEFTSIDPFLLSTDEKFADVNNVDKKIHFPNHWTTAEVRPYSVRLHGGTVKCINAGIAETGFVVRAKFGSTASEFQFNLVDDNGNVLKKMDIIKNFAAGSELMIDTRRKVCEYTAPGGKPTRFFKGITADSEFWLLPVGESNVAYTAGDNEVSVEYRARRLVF